MKQYILNAFFKIYSVKWFPIKYITQNKEEKALVDSCFKELVLGLKKSDIFSKHKGVFFAITNDMIVNRLKRIEEIKLIDIKIPYAESNVNGLKKYLVGENTKCRTCQNRETCKWKKSVEKDSKVMHGHFIFIISY